MGISGSCTMYLWYVFRLPSINPHLSALMFQLKLLRLEQRAGQGNDGDGSATILAHQEQQSRVRNRGHDVSSKIDSSSAD